MGVLRIVPKKEPLQFVSIKPSKPQSSELIKPKELQIILGQATVKVPEGMDPDTLKYVIRALRER